MPGGASLNRFRRAGMALLAALFTALAGVATNRVQGAWWTQGLFFAASIISLFVAASLAGATARRRPHPRKIRKARKKVATKVLPSYYRHEAPTWLNDGLLGELSIPVEYDALNREPRHSTARYAQRDVVTSAQDAFTYSGGQLLILGDAGSGKTHALFQIISNALDQCAKSKDSPLPFYIDLTTWDSGTGGFDRWCVNQISVHYRIPEDYVNYWISESDITLFCDGLDELSRKVRSACISAINRFRQEYGLISIIVASRSQEYSDTPKQLQLNGCLRLKPLSVSAVLGELAILDRRNVGILASVAKDGRLRDLLRTPMFLSLFVQAYYGDSPVEGVRQRRSWRYTIIDAYLEHAEQRGMAHHRGVDLGLRSWLPPIIRQMKAERQAVIYPDRLPLTQLNSQLKSQLERQTTLIATAIVAFCMLAVRIPTLIALRHEPGFPGYILGSAVLIPTSCIVTWKYCRRELAKPIVFRYRFMKGTRTRVFIIWTLLYGTLGNAASLLTRTNSNASLGILFILFAATVAAYPFFGLTRRKEPDTAALPRYPGEETRALIMFNTTLTGIVAASMAVSLFAVESPIMYGSKSLTLAASAYVIPYFLVPFTLIAWLGSGGASVIYIFVARNVQSKAGLLPAKYMASFRALRSSSILVPAAGGYSVVHSLVRDHLAARMDPVRRTDGASKSLVAKRSRNVKTMSTPSNVTR